MPSDFLNYIVQDISLIWYVSKEYVYTPVCIL